MGKKLFFMMLVVLVGGATWFVVDVSVAEMKDFIDPTETANPVLSPPNANVSCASEPTRQELNCQEMEQRILASTLRIVIRTWIIYVEGEGYTTLSSNGHGTVMDGRYLLTHNHFQLPLLELFADHNGEFAKVTLYTADGELLWEGPLTTAAVAYDDTETLLLEFQDRDGQGLFETLGLPSADFAAGEAATLAAGTEVAQINWDENQAHVQWTQVQRTSSEEGTPVVRLDECLIPGASGGGVFLGGVHIANNWTRSWGCQQSGQTEASQHSEAALNSAELLAVSG